MAFTIKPQIAQHIDRAAQQYGVDPVAMRAIAQIESGGDPRAQNPNSSAGGLFQFIDGTAKQYGLTDRFDAGLSSDAAARLMRDNTSHLFGKLGRAPTAGEMYLAHQQGAGGASKLLSNPNARAVDIVGADAVKLNGGNPNMTAAEFAKIWTSKADKLAGNGNALQFPPMDRPEVEASDENKPLSTQQKLGRAGNIIAGMSGGVQIPEMDDKQRENISNLFDKIKGMTKKKGLSL